MTAVTTLSMRRSYLGSVEVNYSGTPLVAKLYIQSRHPTHLVCRCGSSLALPSSHGSGSAMLLAPSEPAKVLAHSPLHWRRHSKDIHPSNQHSASLWSICSHALGFKTYWKPLHFASILCKMDGSHLATTVQRQPLRGYETSWPPTNLVESPVS